MDNTQDQYSFWKRPEGTTGKVVLGLLGAAVVLAFVKYLPFLISLAENTLYLGVLIGAIAALYFIATSSRVHTLISYGFESVMRSITEVFVDLDPVSILKTYIKQMEKREDVVKANLTKLLGAKRQLETSLSQYTQEMNQAIKLADAADRTGNEEQMNVQTEIAGRRSAIIESLRPQIDTIGEVIEAVQRVLKVLNSKIADARDEMEILERKNYEAIILKGATDAAAAVLGDNSDAAEMKAMAADNIRKRYDNALGQLDSLISDTKRLDGEIDLKNMTFRADGRAKLDELRNKIHAAETDTPALSAGAAPRLLNSGATSALSQPASANKWATKIKH